MHADPVRSPDLCLEAAQLPGAGGGHCQRGDGMREPSRRTNGAILRIAGFVLALAVLPAEAAQTDIHGPLGSVAFGTSVRVLPNGNIVVTDPNGPVSNVGAVYMYSPAGVLISTLTGSTANDHVGSSGIVVLSNGNY